MPYYEYQCAANGQTIEVRHGMSEELTTWGQLVDRAAVDLGDTPADSPVKRLVGGGSATNAPVTPSKQSKRWGEESKSLKHGPMAAPPRTKNW